MDHVQERWQRLFSVLIASPVPWVVNGFFKLITPFIDPHTREKLKFNEDMTQYVPAEQLWTEFPGGKLEFEYNHASYWPALNKLAEERRAARTARWIAGGKHVGELEDYLGGALDHGVAPAKGGSETEGEATATEDEGGEAKEAAAGKTGVEDLKIDALKVNDAAPTGDSTTAAKEKDSSTPA